MIICTAGHVDHGKTALLYALTGVLTSRLPEEKKRGLTIDLGYAYLPTDEGSLGFIDVPGHQNFLPNMLAGVGGLDTAMLIVSAVEGIKPQTDEHLTILKLLNFSNIIVVLTKSDLAEKHHIDNLINELKQRYSFLQEAHFFITSAHSGEGIASLKAYLISLNKLKSTNSPFRYAIDRVFNLKGIGLVVTGTAVAGQVQIGDEIYLSNGDKVRVKSIHAQNSKCEQGRNGQRLALNLAGVEKNKVTRGDWLTQLEPNFATDRITVQLETIQQLKESTIIHLYHFASHITGKMNILTPQCREHIGHSPLFAEIILDELLHIVNGDRLIIRSGDDRHTLAGATVIEIHSPKRNKRSNQRLDFLQKIVSKKSIEERVEVYIEHKAVSLPFLAWAEQVGLDTLRHLGENVDEQWLFSSGVKQKIRADIIEKLSDYHLQHNDQLGVTKTRLYRIVALNQPESLVYHIIAELIRNGELRQSRGWLHLPDHSIAFTENELSIWQQVLPLFQQTTQALWVRDVAVTLSIDEKEMRTLLYKAGKLGYLVPIVKDRFLTFEQITKFARVIKGIIQKNGDISVNQLRDEIGYGRKVTVQLIEYFDRVGFLRRKGNVHLLRDEEIYG